MRYKGLKLLALAGISCVMESAFAFQAPEKVLGLGDIAGTLIKGTDFITRLMLVICVIIGVSLVVTAIAYFRAHQLNPKFTPLDKPFFLLLMGLILIGIPFLGKIFGPTASTLDLKKTEAISKEHEKKKKMIAPVDIDAPLEFGNEYEH